MKYKYYVGLFMSPRHHNDVRYLTKVDNATKSWWAKPGERAVAFLSRTAAENMVFALTANGYPACLVTAPDFYEITNGEEQA